MRRRFGGGRDRGEESRFSFGHVTFKVPVRHQRGDATKAVGGGLAGEADLSTHSIKIQGNRHNHLKQSSSTGMVLCPREQVRNLWGCF